MSIFEQCKMSRFVQISLKNFVRTIKLNRPDRKNAMSSDMYKAVKDILNKDASDENVTVTIITGHGDYFTSGNDIKAVLEESSSNADPDEKVGNVKEMVNAFINYPKLLISVVNGPAIGIGATLSGLCDIIYASDRAWFSTPFVQLGLVAEGCSSYLFPFILGRSKASEVLLLNHKLTAQEALQFGFVAKVIPHDSLDGFVEDLHRYGKLPQQSLMKNKKIVMRNFKDILCKCNEVEAVAIAECLESEDFANAVAAFMSRKSKL